MALGDAYATVEEYRNQRDKNSADDDFALTRELAAISRYIDRATGRFLGFNHDDSPVARTYVPRRSWGALDLGDDYYVSVSGVTVDGVALSSSDWELLPRNAALMPEPEPYWQIGRASGFWAAGVPVVVTGIAGWPHVPPAIKAATIELTAILRMESPRATSRVNEMQQVISTSRVAQSIVAELTSVYRNWAVLV